MNHIKSYANHMNNLEREPFTNNTLAFYNKLFNFFFNFFFFVF